MSAPGGDLQLEHTMRMLLDVLAEIAAQAPAGSRDELPPGSDGVEETPGRRRAAAARRCSEAGP